MIRITAKRDGFRRAGARHQGVQEYPDGFFTPEQLEALKAEPLLILETLPDAPEPENAETTQDDDKPAESPEGADASQDGGKPAGRGKRE